MTQQWPAYIDYSYGRPSMQSILNAGYVGAMRYLGTDGRCIGPSERDQLLGAGLGIGLIWETTASRPLSGYGAGVDDANRANHEADKLGAPGEVPIFYAVDFQPTSSQMAGPVTDYFRGCMSVAGRPVRAYGCALVMESLCGKSRFFPDSWQCAAWSYPGTAPGTPIVDGGYNLILSPYASSLQTIGYVLGDTSDHNNLILQPPYWFWGIEGAAPEVDDMPSMEELRAEFTGQTTRPAHQVISGWEKDSRRYHVHIVHDMGTDIWWAVFGIFRLRIVDGYAGWWEARPDVLNWGDQTEGTAIAMVNTTLEVSANNADQLIGRFFAGEPVGPVEDPDQADDIDDI